MAIDYKKELETASKTMILVHDPDTLIRMIVRMIVGKVQVSHASILLQDKNKTSYVLNVSRGSRGLKVPKGFTRMDADNPLIRFFRERKDKVIFNSDVLLYDEGKRFMGLIADSDLKDLLSKTLYQMELFETIACIPSYFRDELLGILMLGGKQRDVSFDRDELDFFIALAHDVAMALRNAQLFNDLKLELKKKEEMFLQMTLTLAAAIEAKDHYTHGHTNRVTNFSLEIAKKISASHKKLVDASIYEDIKLAALLHDIGKIGVPEAILNKQGPLSTEEWERIKQHPLIGVNILQPIHELKTAILGVKYHHERFDGKGYPEGLRGDQIPLVACIIAVADAYDAMTTDRPYRKGLSKEQAVEEIKLQSGKQFSPIAVQAFLEAVEDQSI